MNEQPLDTNFAVPVKVWVPQRVYKVVHARYGTRSPEFLSKLILRALTDRPVRNIDTRPRKPRVRRTPELESQVVQLHAEGKRSVLIAVKLDVSTSTVSRILKARGLKPHGSWRS